MRLLTVDPGKMASGWAYFESGKLVDCGMCASAPMRMLFGDLTGATVVVEKPQIYPHTKLKGDPNDLVDVALEAGAVGEVLSSKGATVLFVRPHAWKGSRPKKVDNMRTISLMLPHELVLLERAGIAKHKRHNVVDAIGIGLWKTGRRK